MKRKFLFLTLIVYLFTPLTLWADDSASLDSQQIVASMDQQRDAWNRNDMKTFVSVYADSDSTLYVTNNGIVKGYDAIRQQYFQHYSSKAKMGILSFKNLEIKFLSNQYAMVIGQWFLQRNKEAGGNVGGYFTLLFTKTPQGWKIAVDHSS